MANHKGAECVLAEEVLDEVQPRIPVELKMVKFDRFDALRYVGALFALTGGGKPPFDLSKVKGGVVIYSPDWPIVYAGVIDGPGGAICHARGIPRSLHQQVLDAIEKGKA
jgi:hypothetical protein